MKSHVTLAIMALLLSSACFAQYRYVAPDGTVSYSDTPPAGPASKVTVKNLPIDAPLVAASSLPYALSQAQSKFPVTLYTSASCASCDAARSYLKQRGVPFTEKTVGSDLDLAVVKRVSGDTAVPVVMIGTQKSVGFAQSVYAGMLDDAGYPATSVLPRDYSYPAPVAAAGPQANPPVAPANAVGAASNPPPNVQMAEPPPPQGNAPPGFKF
jgi:glutaredoxin